jgi:gluconokinase
MHAGHALTDEDRWPWLARVASWIWEHADARRPGIITCSALKRFYRDMLRAFVYSMGHASRSRSAWLCGPDTSCRRCC